MFHAGRCLVLMLLAALPALGAAPAPAPAWLGSVRGSGLPVKSFGFFARPVDGSAGGPPLAALNEEQPYVLASTAKVVTSLAALDLLGANYRWRTYAFLGGPLIAGRLRGDLLIVGGGDAQLSSADLRQWFAQMRASGLDEIDGHIVLDRYAFRFQDGDQARTPKPALNRPHHQWPDALTVDGFAPPVLGEPKMRAIAALWREAGGRLGGRVLEKARPDRTDLFPLDAQGQPQLPWQVHLSQPLPEVIHAMNKVSDNLVARNLMLSLTRGFPLRPATMADAQSRMQDWLRRQGLADGDIEIETGSGLSRAERGKPRAMVQLLCNAWRARMAQAFVDSLPIAGVDGTLAHRLQHGQATGQAYLKTGTLLDARALAGYVRARSGRVYAVAAFANHPEAARATPALDAFIEWVARNG